MSDYDHDQDDEENEQEENLFEDEYSGFKNVTIILIDINADMFGDNCLMKTCLKSVYDQMSRMLLRGYRRNISVCLLQDDEIILTALNDNLVDSCKKILELLNQSTDELKQKFERTSAPSLCYSFSECLKQIKNIGKIHPHIVLLTNDDDPHKGDVKENLSAIDVALFFKESNVKLVVLPLKQDFNYEYFYGGLLKAANDVPLDFLTSEDRVYDSVESINEILDCIIKNKVTIRRFYFRLYNKADQELGFMTQVRYLANSAHLYSNCHISRVTKNKVVLGYEDQKLVDEDRCTIKVDFDKFITIEKKEFANMSERSPIGFQLLYLTDQKRTSMHFNYRRCMILQNDELFQQSDSKKVALFDDLWHYCRENNKIMICGYRAVGNNQVPHITEFIPDVFQNKPCFVGQIFADCEQVGDYPSEDESDLEKINLKPKYKIPANDRELGNVCEMIDKLTVKNFTPAKFSCYDYDVKAALIKAHLLETSPAEVKDTIPSNDDIDAKMGTTLEKVKDIFAVTEPPKPKKTRKNKDSSIKKNEIVL